MEEHIIIKFIEKKTSEQENLQVLRWIEESEENKKQFCELKNMWVATDIIVSESQTKSKKTTYSTIHRYTSAIIKIAAVAAMIVAVFFIGRHIEKNAWIKIVDEQYTEINVPHGETTSITLTDGTTVKLNSGAKFRFSKKYGISERNVELNGEGYFEVLTNKTFPFVVHTSHLKVKVTGTKFNVSSYKEDRKITATLDRGSVTIENLATNKETTLKPNETYTYDKIDGKTTINKKTYEQDWKDGVIVVNGEDIIEFAKRIERKFNVKINISEQLKGKCSYTGVFKNEKLTEILDIMKTASPINYSIDKNTIQITARNTEK